MKRLSKDLGKIHSNFPLNTVKAYEEFFNLCRLSKFKTFLDKMK